MSHTTKSIAKMVARTRRIKGQIEAIEKALEGDSGSEHILQLVASCRGALNGLMAELIEGHLQFHALFEITLDDVHQLVCRLTLLFCGAIAHNGSSDLLGFYAGQSQAHILWPEWKHRR